MQRFKRGDRVICNGNEDAVVQDYYSNTMVNVRLFSGARVVGDVCVGEGDLVPAPINFTGLRVYILKKASGDCSAGGISSRFDEAVLMLPSWPVTGPKAGASAGPLSVQKSEKPLVRIFFENICGQDYARAFPVDENGQKLPGWWMFGGCYIETSDSRFPWDYPVKLMDRKE